MRTLIIVLFLAPCLALSQHSIKGTFTPAKEFNFVLLYKVSLSTSEYIDNAQIQADGKFEMALDSSLEAGVYRIVYALPQDKFNFDIIYNGRENIEFVFEMDEGISFQSSEENKQFNTYKNGLNNFNQTINTLYGADPINEEAITKTFNQFNDFQLNFETSSKGLIAHNFITALRQYTPASYEPLNAYAKNLRSNYFKYLDLNNPTLLNSNVILDKLVAYVLSFGQATQKDKAYVNEIDEVVKFTAGNNELKRIGLALLWNHFSEQNEAVANYITDTYLLDIALASGNTDLQQKLVSFKTTSIGELAVNFEIDKNTDLQSLTGYSKYLLLFWSSSCSHCLDQLPKVKQFFENYSGDNTTKVIAIGLEDEPSRWEREIGSYKDFMHVYATDKWENELAKTYGITATPSYFVLDADKKIIAKPNSFKELERFYSTLNR